MPSSRNVSLCGGTDEALEAAALPPHSAERLSLSAGVIINFLLLRLSLSKKLAGADGKPYRLSALCGRAAKNMTVPAQG